MAAAVEEEAVEEAVVAVAQESNYWRFRTKRQRHSCR
jgi:hypothetical protein